MSQSDELAKKLAHRNAVNEGEAAPKMGSAPTSVYTEFDEFTRKQIKYYEEQFKKYDTDHSGALDQGELQWMMEKLECPQTYVGLKAMIKLVDEDGDGEISFREFLLIFRKANADELGGLEGLQSLVTHLSEIDVDETGVLGAKDFFEAKAKQASASSKHEAEIQQEKEEKLKKQQEDRERKERFAATKSNWK